MPLIHLHLHSYRPFSDTFSDQLLSGLSARQVDRQKSRFLLGVFDFLPRRYGHFGRSEHFRRLDGSTEKHSEGNAAGDPAHDALVSRHGGNGWRCDGPRRDWRCGTSAGRNFPQLRGSQLHVWSATFVPSNRACVGLRPTHLRRLLCGDALIGAGLAGLCA